MILGIWGSAAIFLALFLGAIGVSSEIGAKTIVHVMSRPVELLPRSRSNAG
jgi:ABC-type transport system involved in multi-copper enzyme maturation permease subunit